MQVYVYIVQVLCSILCTLHILRIYGWTENLYPACVYTERSSEWKNERGERLAAEGEVKKNWFTNDNNEKNMFFRCEKYVPAATVSTGDDYTANYAIYIRQQLYAGGGGKLLQIIFLRGGKRVYYNVRI